MRTPVSFEKAFQKFVGLRPVGYRRRFGANYTATRLFKEPETYVEQSDYS
jgi:hypothetical protein